MDELYKLHADFCKFMGHSKRIETIFILGDREISVDSLAHRLKISLPNTSQHLAMMRSRGLVKVRSEGVRKFYSLSTPKILKACLLMQELMRERLEARMIDMRPSKSKKSRA